MRGVRVIAKSLKKRLGVWAIVVAGVLMIPLLTKAQWTQGDYVFAGTVLFVLAAIYELATRNTRNFKHKLIVAAVLLGVIVLIIGWAATGPDSEAIIKNGR
jgi:hypothetical protein